ncbi:MAG: threonine ammonia-lyase, biosynthetic, partial [Halioglobus sp.]|nr:threonine ammonia-lyase, biosynthetic [Halioglobus sp.]
MKPPDYTQKIATADVYRIAERTPLDHASLLSRRLGNEVLLKREDLQPYFSFKLRGAANKLNQLPAATLAKGVICSSAGNHAQGVALAAREKGVKAIIVMPATTPGIKVDAVRMLGGEVILHGDNYDAAFARAKQLQEELGLAFIHPFDDPDVIAGQGTVGKELLEQCTAAPDAVFVPIGGGGLISGIATWLKTHSPGTRIIGVEAEESAGMQASLAAGHPVILDHVGIFADGVAVRRIGDETFRLCQQLVDDIVIVDTDQICAAVQGIFEDTRSIVEPAGALAVAGLKQYVSDTGERNKSFVAINSGANVNFDRLRHIAERAALGEH